MCAFRGVARLVPQSILKTEGLKWMAVVFPFFFFWLRKLFIFPQGQIFCPVCGLEKLQEKGRENYFFTVPRNWIEIAQTTHRATSAFNQFVSTLKLLVRGPCGNLAVPSFSLSQFFHFLLFIIIFLFKSVFLNLTNHKNHLNAC